VIVTNPSSSLEETRRLPVSASGSGNQLWGSVPVDESTAVTASRAGESQFVAVLIDEAADWSSETSTVYDELGGVDGTQSQLDAQL